MTNRVLGTENGREEPPRRAPARHGMPISDKGNKFKTKMAKHALWGKRKKGGGARAARFPSPADSGPRNQEKGTKKKFTLGGKKRPWGGGRKTTRLGEGLHKTMKVMRGFTSSCRESEGRLSGEGGLMTTARGVHKRQTD